MCARTRSITLELRDKTARLAEQNRVLMNSFSKFVQHAYPPPTAEDMQQEVRSASGWPLCVWRALSGRRAPQISGVVPTLQPAVADAVLPLQSMLAVRLARSAAAWCGRR